MTAAWLEVGSEGPEVRAWQRIFGLPWRKVDGKFGPVVTLVKCKAWQSARALEADGIVGVATRAALLPGDLIKPWEGCVLQTYDDAQDAPLPQRLLRHVNGQWRRPDGSLCRQVPTIGWGDTAPPRLGVEFCTQLQADRWFMVDLERTRLPLARRYPTRPQGPPDTPGEVAAKLSFIYNNGAAEVLKDGGPGPFVRLALTGFAESEWLAYNKTRVNGVKIVDAGLKMRREEEYAIFFASRP